jgi:hypothetical protein
MQSIYSCKPENISRNSNPKNRTIILRSNCGSKNKHPSQRVPINQLKIFGNAITFLKLEQYLNTVCKALCHEGTREPCHLQICNNATLTSQVAPRKPHSVRSVLRNFPHAKANPSPQPLPERHSLNHDQTATRKPHSTRSVRPN